MHGYSGMGEGWVLYSYPIHMAVSQDSVSYLRLLLKHGADPLKEYSDFNSLNKYQTTIALLEAAKRKKHLHTIVMLQTISSLEKNTFGINDMIYQHVKTVFSNLAQQENAEVLQDVLIEFAGSRVTKDTAYVPANPLKLKQLCRKSIRQAYRLFLKDADKNTVSLTLTLNNMPLPRLLISYLLLQEEVKIYETYNMP